MSNLEFTKEWLSPRLMGIWRDIFTSLRPGKILEIGSFEGRSAAFFFEEAVKYGPVEIHCVDTWEGSFEHHVADPQIWPQIEARFNGNISALAARGAVIAKHKGRSADILRKFSGPFDLIYIDGSHDAVHVLEDAVLAFPLLRDGGILAFDDYLWVEYWKDEKNQDVRRRPKAGIDVFTSVYWPFICQLAAPTNEQVYFRKICGT